jgi:hypothetical protein
VLLLLLLLFVVVYIYLRIYVFIEVTINLQTGAISYSSLERKFTLLVNTRLFYSIFEALGNLIFRLIIALYFRCHVTSSDAVLF